LAGTSFELPVVGWRLVFFFFFFLGIPLLDLATFEHRQIQRGRWRRVQSHSRWRGTPLPLLDLILFSSRFRETVQIPLRRSVPSFSSSSLAIRYNLLDYNRFFLFSPLPIVSISHSQNHHQVILFLEPLPHLFCPLYPFFFLLVTALDPFSLFLSSLYTFYLSCQRHLFRSGHDLLFRKVRERRNEETRMTFIYFTSFFYFLHMYFYCA